MTAAIVAAYRCWGAAAAPAEGVWVGRAGNWGSEVGPVGAASRPQGPVKTTGFITRGVVSGTRARQSAVMARLCSSTWVVIACTVPSPQPESGGDGGRV